MLSGAGRSEAIHMSGNIFQRAFKNLFIGRARQLNERGLFHTLSLATMLAWIGLGADGLSSSCYGPEEAYKALLTHPHLAVFVAAMSAITVIVICASYSQIIGLFPAGGGGYVVASRLLSPTAGVISGSALLIDYVLTIAISVASAMDALFSFLPPEMHGWKLWAGVAGIILLTVLNLRGVRESVVVWVPVFGLFLLTHTFGIFYAMWGHLDGLTGIVGETRGAVRAASSELGWLGVMALLLRAYSMGAGTYTGIEAVSNGLSILREPRVRTGRRTMVLIAISLAGMVAGLMIAYLVVGVQPVPGKTLNAVLFENIAAGWSPGASRAFVVAALGSAAALLLVAAQAGFLGGPPVLAGMAVDRWMPARYAALSDRFVTINGVVLMGGAALVVLLLTQGRVHLLVVLYSINVFITFSLSQSGMVRHWWKERAADWGWFRRITVNAVGLALTVFILFTLVVLKFHEGGWVTVLVTAAFVALAFGIRRHYTHVRRQLARLEVIVEAARLPAQPGACEFAAASTGLRGQTAVVLVSGFNGLGLHTLLGAVRLFGKFRSFVFVQIGIVDAGNFKGVDEIERLRASVVAESAHYVEFVRSRGGEAEAITSIGNEVIDEFEKLLPALLERHPQAVFFTGQLVFEKETLLTRWLHNFTGLELQRRLAWHGVPCAVVPVRVTPQGVTGQASAMRA